MAIEAALARNDELTPQCATYDEPDGHEAQPENGDWNDEPREGESAAERLTRLEDAQQVGKTHIDG